VVLPAKLWGHTLRPGDRVRVVTPGGGGHGGP
jgi:N-methylhydantoinase B/oxoprolinase/acetone carboxylase alpha subunit